MKKIIVVNGKFYAGINAQGSIDLTSRRSAAKKIEGNNVNYYVSEIFSWMERKEVELRRFEVLDIKEDKNV